MIKNGFTLTTEPIERWLQGCGCKDLTAYYHNASCRKKKILDRLYHEYKRLNLSDTRILYFFSIMEEVEFIRDREKNRKEDEEEMVFNVLKNVELKSK